MAGKKANKYVSTRGQISSIWCNCHKERQICGRSQVDEGSLEQSHQGDGIWVSSRGTWNIVTWESTFSENKRVGKDKKKIKWGMHGKHYSVVREFEGKIARTKKSSLASDYGALRQSKEFNVISVGSV